MLVTIEDERIRNHLENTEKLMREADISHLTQFQKQNRIKLIDYLHDYWNFGVFPINTDFPMLRLPHIKDKFGTPCAMAYLIEREGSQGLCDELVKTNNVFIKDVQKDHDLIKWCTENGITQEEASQVQPAYNWGPGGPGTKPRPTPGPPRNLPPRPPGRGGKPILPGKPNPGTRSKPRTRPRQTPRPIESRRRATPQPIGRTTQRRDTSIKKPRPDPRKIQSKRRKATTQPIGIPTIDDIATVPKTDLLNFYEELSKPQRRRK